MEFSSNTKISTLKSYLGEYLTFSEIKLTSAEKLAATILSALAGWLASRICIVKVCINLKPVEHVALSLGRVTWPSL
jgi:hypothetical protein